MSKLEYAHPPRERHYANLLAALYRSAKAKPVEQSALVMLGIVRSLDGNGEPERTGITNLVLSELSTHDAQRLSDFIARGTAANGVPPAHAGSTAKGRKERRRNRNGDEWSTPWLPARERRQRPLHTEG